MLLIAFPKFHLFMDNITSHSINIMNLISRKSNETNLISTLYQPQKK